jgi:hypothetical protein
MDADRFDRLAPALTAGTYRRQVIGGREQAAFGVPSVAAAQEAAPATPRATPGAGDAARWLHVQPFAAATLAPDPRSRPDTC